MLMRHKTRCKLHEKPAAATDTGEKEQAGDLRRRGGGTPAFIKHIMFENELGQSLLSRRYKRARRERRMPLPADPSLYTHTKHTN